MAEKKDRANDRELAWEEVRTEHLIRDRWIDLRRSAFRYPDGKIWEPYYNYTRRDYAIVVASDEEGNYLCVFSGSTAEEALAAAKRELREETGYESDQWTYLMRVPACASLSDNYAFLFAAENCRKITEQKLDEMELLQVEKHTAAEIEEMIRTEEFPQTDHILAWMLWNKGAF